MKMIIKNFASENEKNLQILLLTILMLVNIDAMEKHDLPSQDEIEKICEQIEKRKRAKEAERVMQLFTKLEARKFKNIDFDESCFSRLVKNPDEGPLLEAVAKWLPQTEAAVLFKHDLLNQVVINNNLEGASILVRAGAKADYIFEPHFLLHPKIKAILLNCRHKREGWRFYSLFLRNGLDPDLQVEGCESTKSLLERAFSDNIASVNTILYHGAKMIVPPHYSFDRFTEHAHARRIYRMAKYLQRCFGTVKHPKAEHALFLPNEIAMMITERRYGPLSAEDNKLIEGYHENDYKRAHK